MFSWDGSHSTTRWAGRGPGGHGELMEAEQAAPPQPTLGGGGGTWSPALSLLGLLTLEKSHRLSGRIQTSVEVQPAADHPAGRGDQALGAGTTATAQRVLQEPRVLSVCRDRSSQEGPSQGSPRTAPERPSSWPDLASSGLYRESTALEREVSSVTPVHLLPR